MTQAVFKCLVVGFGLLVHPLVAQGATVNFGAEKDVLHVWSVAGDLLEKPPVFSGLLWASQMPDARDDLRIWPAAGGTLTRPDFVFEAYGQIAFPVPVQ